MSPINIISDSIKSDKIGGPNKVIRNLIKGLDKINYPYVINKSLSNYKYNYIQDSAMALIDVSLRKIPAVIGPNLGVLPSNLPVKLNMLKSCIYLQPSKWCIDLWRILGAIDNQIYPWPVGIDTDDFLMKKKSGFEKNVMIYFKRRDFNLLEIVKEKILSKGLNPLVIKYGSYEEKELKAVLGRSIFGIWIGVSESQGIGLQESLASGLPLIVCDVNTLFESSDINEYKFPEHLRTFKPTSAPYFDKTCGIVINDFAKLDSAIDEIQSNISSYNPRKFIVENLSLEKQANELISFFELLKNEQPIYFNTPIKVEKNNEFKLSGKGYVIYLSFVLRRKTMTLLRIVKNSFK